MTVFGNISLSTIELKRGYMPLINILALKPIEISEIQDNDYFLLEKIEIPRDDSDAIIKTDNIVGAQSMMYFMDEPARNSWQPNISYTVGDVVHFQNNMYSAKITHISSYISNGVPGFVIDSDKWQHEPGLFVERNDYIYHQLWTGNTEYNVDDTIRISITVADPGVYKCLQDHTSSDDTSGLFDPFYDDITYWTKISDDAYETIESNIDSEHEYTYTHYMGRNFSMGDVSLDPYMAQYIDVSKYFRNFYKYIIDNTADIETYRYLYRIIIRYQGIEYSSSYITGINHIPESHHYSNDLYVGDIKVSTGNLYKSHYDGIILKGIPIYAPSYRFSGPIEDIKMRAYIRDINNYIGWSDMVMNNIETTIDNTYSDLRDMFEELAI